MHRALMLSFAALAVAVTGACRPAAGDAPEQTVVDGVMDRTEELRRFRAALPPVESLSGGAPTREALIRRFVAALAERDTGALRDLLLSPAEFAWLYYPHAREARPPYDLSPGLLWFTIATRSDHDLGVALQEFGGRPLRYAGSRCAAEPRVEGPNRLWGFCEVTLQVGDGPPQVERLHGLILERSRRFKFVSYANRLS